MSCFFLFSPFRDNFFFLFSLIICFLFMAFVTFAVPTLEHDEPSLVACHVLLYLTRVFRNPTLTRKVATLIGDGKFTYSYASWKVLSTARIEKLLQIDDKMAQRIVNSCDTPTMPTVQNTEETEEPDLVLEESRTQPNSSHLHRCRQYAIHLFSSQGVV